MALYFVSSFYMLISKLSPSYSVNIAEFVNDLDFVAIFRLSDICFLFSCLCFLFVLCL